MSIETPRDVPEQWRPFFDKKGIEFTFRALERKSPGVAANTIIRALYGEKKTTNRVVAAVCEALGMSTETFYELQGKPPVEPFVLPARASQLSTREREVVRDVVYALLDAREKPAAQPDASIEAGQAQEAGLSNDGQNGAGFLGPDVGTKYPGVDGAEDGEDGEDLGRQQI